MRTLNVVEDLGAGITEARAKVLRQRAVGDKVPGQQNDIWVQRIDAVDHFSYEKWLCVVVVVDIADLRDAQTVKCIRQAAQADGMLDDFEMVPVPETGIPDEAAAGGKSGDLKKAASVNLCCRRGVNHALSG